jgi:acyl carrier protein
MPMDPSQVADDLISIVKRVNPQSSEPTLDSALVADLGFDSLRLLELIAEMEDHFNVFIPLNEVPAIKTVGQAVAHVTALLETQGPR